MYLHYEIYLQGVLKFVRIDFHKIAFLSRWSDLLCESPAWSSGSRLPRAFIFDRIFHFLMHSNDNLYLSESIRLFLEGLISKNRIFTSACLYFLLYESPAWSPGWRFTTRFSTGSGCLGAGRAQRLFAHFGMQICLIQEEFEIFLRWSWI